MSKVLRDKRVADPVLTNIALGYKNAQFIGEALFPIVNVDKEGFTIPKFGKEMFAEYETERAVGANSNVMPRRDQDKIDVVLREHDLAYPVDYREQRESIFDEESRAVKLSKDGIEGRRERECARLAQLQATYVTGSKVTLASDKKWAKSGGDPLGDIDTGKEAIRKRIGIRPNTILMGASAYYALRRHAQLQAQLGANKDKLITLEQLKEILEVGNIVVGESLSGNQQLGDIWGDNFILAYSAEGTDGVRSKEEPSFGYTFRLSGMPIGDRYESEDLKVTFSRYTDIYKTIVTFPEAGYLISSVSK